VSNQQLLPNSQGKIQMANTLKLWITQTSDQVINGFCICLILGLSTAAVTIRVCISAGIA
jgi:hypothetical protein